MLGISEVDIAAKLGVDNATISKDVKALKLISQQFIYDITKSDFTYYYKQCLDMVRLVLRGQVAIHSRFNKLITALMTAVEKGDGSLDKEATSHDDLMDAFHMSLLFWH